MQERDQPMNVMIDVSPAMPHQGTTLASCLCPLLQAVGRPEWTNGTAAGRSGACIPV